MRAKIFLPILMVVLTTGSNWAQEQQESKQEAPPASSKQEQQPAAPATGAPPGQYPHTYNISAEQKERKNPVRFTDASVEHGKKLFISQCAACHGETGDGKGDVAEEMKIQPPDFSKPDVLSKRTDGELFAIISTGSGVMPPESERMAERQKWDIVNFLRSLQGKVPAKATEQERQAEQHIVTVPQ